MLFCPAVDDMKANHHSPGVISCVAEVANVTQDTPLAAKLKLFEALLARENVAPFSEYKPREKLAEALVCPCEAIIATVLNEILPVK